MIYDIMTNSKDVHKKVNFIINHFKKIYFCSHFRQSLVSKWRICIRILNRHLLIEILDPPLVVSESKVVHQSLIILYCSLDTLRVNMNLLKDTNSTFYSGSERLVEF